MKSFKRKAIGVMVGVVSLVALSVPAFADGNSTGSWSDSVSIGSETVNLSKNVKGDYKGGNAATSSGSDYQSYSAATYNAAGTKAFGIASGLTRIKYQECTNGDCSANKPSDPVSDGNSTDFSSGWNDM